MGGEKVCSKECEYFTEDTESYLSRSEHYVDASYHRKSYYCGKTKQFWTGAKWVAEPCGRDYYTCIYDSA